MEITGTVIAAPASITGISGKGPWKKAFKVIRYEDGQYPKDILLSAMKNADEFERISIGAKGTFKFDASAKEGQSGKWYCDLNCWSWKLEQAF